MSRGNFFNGYVVDADDMNFLYDSMTTNGLDILAKLAGAIGAITEITVSNMDVIKEDYDTDILKLVFKQRNEDAFWFDIDSVMMKWDKDAQYRLEIDMDGLGDGDYFYSVYLNLSKEHDSYALNPATGEQEPTREYNRMFLEQETEATEGDAQDPESNIDKVKLLGIKVTKGSGDANVVATYYEGCRYLFSAGSLNGTRDLKSAINQLGAAYVNVEDGSADGQMVFWHAGDSEYKHTENTEIFWDDISKRLGLFANSPTQKVEIGDTAGYTSTTNMGTNDEAFASKKYVDDTAGGSGSPFFTNPVNALVIDATTTAPGVGLPAGADGQRYILQSNTGSLHANWGTITGVGDNDVVERTSGTWVVVTDVSVVGEGITTFDSSSNNRHNYNGTSWIVDNAYNLSTGLIDGGVISIYGGDNALIDITAGSGQIIDTTTDPDNPVYTPISWDSFDSYDLTTTASAGDVVAIFLSIDETGALIERSQLGTPEQRRNTIDLGVVARNDSNDIVLFVNTPTNFVHNPGSSVQDFFETWGAFSVDGNKVEPNTTDLQIKKLIGNVFRSGVNARTNGKSPHVQGSAAQTPINPFNYKLGDGTDVTVAATQIDPDNYDDGSSAIASVPSGKFTVQRISMFAQGTVEVLYGQQIFNLLSEAKAALPTIDFIVPADSKGAIPLAYLIIKEGTTDLTDDVDAEFFQINTRGKIGGIGFQNLNSSGMVYDPGLTKNPDGSIDVGDGVANLFQTNDFTGDMKQYGLIGLDDQVLTDLDTNYVVADYNSGSPIFRVTLNVLEINESDVIPVYTIYRSGTTLEVLEWGQVGTGLVNKLHARLVKTDRFAHESGVALGEAATRYITTTNGVIWVGGNRTLIPATNSSTDQCEFWYHVSGVWTKSDETTYNNSQYDDGTDLQTLSGPGYGVVFVYQGVESDPHVYYVLGSESYTLVNAQTSQPPGNLPEVITSHAVLVGRIIVGSGDSTAEQIDSAFTKQFVAAPITDHNNLSNVQGGAANNNQHYGLFTTVANAEASGGHTDGDMVYVVETEAWYRYEADGAAYTDDNTYVLSTGDGGNTRFLAKAGKYLIDEFNVKSTANDTTVISVETSGSSNKIVELIENGVGDGRIKINDASGTTWISLWANFYSYFMDDLYVGANTGTARLEATVADDEDKPGLIINQNDVTNNPNAVEINNAGTGNSLQINTDEFVVKADGTLNVAGVTDYEDLVTSDDVIPNRKFVVDNNESTKFNVNQSTHGLSVLDAIYHNGTIYTEAQADDAETLGMLIVTEVIDTNNFVATLVGKTTITSHGLTIGEYYFVSDSVAGGLTATEPGTGSFSNPILFAVDANTLIVLPFRPSSVVDETGELSVISTATTYGLTNANDVLECTATLTVNLQAVAGATKKRFDIKNSGVGTVTLDGNSTEEIDGDETVEISAGDSRTIIANTAGTAWMLI